MYRRWDIWFASVSFEEKPGLKDRPVLIMSGDSGIYVLALKMTSHLKRNEDDYLLKNWGKAGLDCETVVRISKLSQIPIGKMIHRIGRLDAADIIEIDRIIKEKYRNPKW